MITLSLLFTTSSTKVVVIGSVNPSLDWGILEKSTLIPCPTGDCRDVSFGEEQGSMMVAMEST